MGYYVEYTWVLPKYGRTVVFRQRVQALFTQKPFEESTKGGLIAYDNYRSILCGAAYKIGYEHGKNARK